HESAQSLLRFNDGAAAKLREKRLRLFNFPANIRRNQQDVLVGQFRFLEFAFEVLDALIELIDAFDRPRPTEMCARPAFTIVFAEGRDDSHLRLAYLKKKQQRAEHEDQQRANDEV